MTHPQAGHQPSKESVERCADALGKHLSFSLEGTTGEILSEAVLRCAVNECGYWPSAPTGQLMIGLGDKLETVSWEQMRAALNEIACYEQGDLGPHLDEPSAARIAREALEGK